MKACFYCGSKESRINLRGIKECTGCGAIIPVDADRVIEDNHTTKDNYYRESQTELHNRFCGECGKKLMPVANRGTGGYDEETGDEYSIIIYQCPNYDDEMIGRHDKHIETQDLTAEFHELYGYTKNGARNRRIVSRYLLFPTTLGNMTRWLCHAKICQVRDYAGITDDCMGRIMGWFDEKFID